LKKKIFIGPTEIAGYYTNLSVGFKNLGCEVDFYTYNIHPFDYKNNIELPYLIEKTQFFNLHKKKVKFLKKIIFYFLAEICSFLWAINAVFKYDVFIFAFGNSLMRFNIDLYLLSFLNKTIISNLGHGSDTRPSFLNGAFHSDTSYSSLSLNDMILLSKKSKKLLKRHQKHTNYIIGYPLSTYFFSEKNFINFLEIGLPSIGDNFNTKISEIKELQDQKTIRILHSPSHKIGKGTHLIDNAISNLINKGYLIDFRLISNKSNAEVIDEIKKCDFVVDQVFSDTPLAGLASEAAFYGKPSVVGGYGFEYLRKLIGEDSFPPSKTCHPEDIESAIERLILNKYERLYLGEMAQKFILSKWSRKIVASRYLKIINGEIPDKWWVNPYEIFYLEGYGLPKIQTIKNVKRLIEYKGLKSLQLSHNQKLEKAFFDYAKLFQEFK
jgi:hypothetical protein